MSTPLSILLLVTDQQRADTLGCVNPAIRTPHLDRLAAEGLRLDRLYPPTPVCLPCRASLATGQYPSTHGATHNHSALPMDYPKVVAQAFTDAGYRTHMIGKSHLNPCHGAGSPEAAPLIFDTARYRDWHGPWYGFEHADISVGHSTETHAASMHYRVWLEDRGIDPERFFGHTAYAAYGVWDLPADATSSHWVAETTIASMAAAQAEGKPFYIWANFPDPHNPCCVPEPWASMYNPDDLPAFGFKPGEPDCFEDKPPFYREILQTEGDYAARYSDPAMPGADNVSHFEWTERQRQENAAHYYGMVSLIDEQVGRILDALEVSGQAEHTLVVFTSDHGDLLGDHGLWWKGIFAYEECLRVPGIARLPGRIPAGAVTQALTGLLDLAPTFFDFAGVAPPPWLEGRSQGAVWAHPDEEPGAGAVVVEHRPWSTAWNQRILVTRTHKLIVYAGRDYGELYDLASDPDQIRNLWADPRHHDLRDQLMARLLSAEMNRRPVNPAVPVPL